MQSFLKCRGLLGFSPSFCTLGRCAIYGFGFCLLGESPSFCTLGRCTLCGFGFCLLGGLFGCALCFGSLIREMRFPLSLFLGRYFSLLRNFVLQLLLRNCVLQLLLRQGN